MESMKKLNKKGKQLLSGAEELFFKYGYKRVTVEEICRVSQVSKMTFYKYFDNKTDIFKQVILKMYSEGFAVLEEENFLRLSFPEKLENILVLKRQFSEKASREFIEDFMHTDEELAVFFNETTDHYMRKFIGFIRGCQEKGEVRRDMKPEFLMAVLTQMIDWLKTSDIHKIYEDYTDFVLEVNKFLFYGILPVEKVKGRSFHYESGTTNHRNNED